MDDTLVLARTPDEKDEAFERRVAARVATVAPDEIREILLVSRGQAKGAEGWMVSSLDASAARLAVCRATRDGRPYASGQSVNASRS